MDSPAHRRERARSLVADHTPSDLAERVHLDRLLTLLKRDADVFARSHFEPGHVTASAALVDAVRERLLLIEHIKLGRWLQPGGHVEPADSDLRAAARREVAEEVDIRDLSEGMLIDVDVHAIPATQAEPAHEHFDVRFLFVVDSGTPRPGDGVRRARWFTFGDLDSIETDESVRRLARKALDPSV